MSYDLRHEPWIPWRRRSGRTDWGSPWMLVDDLEGEDPVVGIAAPRPDFDGAVQEFLVGLLTAALAPADEAAWKAIRDAPPGPDALRAALDALPDAFDLEGAGPRFFQDLTVDDFADTRPGPVAQLLIDTPGDQTLRLNKDLFIKRGRVERLGRPAAAMALLTLQTYAPSGGQGHRTSLRGGGPLTTLVDPRVNAKGEPDLSLPLWKKLWANVETRQQLAARALQSAPREIEAAFPWLRPPRTSNPKRGGKATRAGEAHPLEAYFGVPRRIRLEFGDAGSCDLTGREDARTVTGFSMLNYGAQYEDWRHPLTPHYRPKADAAWLPLHGQPGGVGWRDWLGLALEAPAEALRRPAATVPAYARRARNEPPPRLHVFGYDMDNMKARAWVEASLPLLHAEEERRELLYATASRLVNGTGLAASLLLGAVKRVLFDDRKAPGDVGYLRDELWAALEAAFYRVLERTGAPALDESAAWHTAEEERARFAGKLRDAALAVFDRWCPAGASDPRLLRRRVVARQDLQWALEGRSKMGAKLFDALDVPPPESGSAPRNRRTKEAAT